MLYPMRLQKGDTIGVIAPAGPPDEESLIQAIPFFEHMGLHVQLGKNIDKVHGYLAGTDQERLADLHAMFSNPDIKAIIFARGGYGTGRIAASIDYGLIRNNPKIIWGYSDITYLHTAIRQATGLVTFHGPMLASDISKDDFDKLSASMFEQLFEPTEIIYSEKISPLNIRVTGEVTGKLVGGNLSLLVSSIGTSYEIDTRGKILLLEDIGEEPYQIDGMLNQLKLAGKFSDAAGIVIGDFSRAEPKLDPSLSIEQVFDDYFNELHGPVMGGFKIGHCMPNIAIPLGVNATLSTIKKTLAMTPGVQ